MPSISLIARRLAIASVASLGCLAVTPAGAFADALYVTTHP